MVDIFKNLIGDTSGMNPDLILVFASIFFLFVVTEFCRFVELTLDFIFRRKK